MYTRPTRPPPIRPLWLSKNPEKFFNCIKSHPYYTEHPYVVKFHLPETYRSGETVISPCLIFGKYMLDYRQSFEKNIRKSSEGQDQRIFGSPRRECRSWTATAIAHFPTET